MQLQTVQWTSCSRRALLQLQGAPVYRGAYLQCKATACRGLLIAGRLGAPGGRCRPCAIPRPAPRRAASCPSSRAPGSLTSWAPLCSFACHTQNTAPDGSANTPMRPAPSTSNGSVSTLPLASSTFAAALSALSTQTFVFHTGVGGRVVWLGPDGGDVAARSCATKYRPREPADLRFSNSHPNRPA